MDRPVADPSSDFLARQDNPQVLAYRGVVHPADLLGDHPHVHVANRAVHKLMPHNLRGDAGLARRRMHLVHHASHRADGRRRALICFANMRYRLAPQLAHIFYLLFFRKGVVTVSSGGRAGYQACAMSGMTGSTHLDVLLIEARNYLPRTAYHVVPAD